MTYFFSPICVVLGIYQAQELNASSFPTTNIRYIKVHNWKAESNKEIVLSWHGSARGLYCAAERGETDLKDGKLCNS